MQTAIVKWGNSQGIRFPKLLLDSANLSSDDTVEVIAGNNCLIIKKAENKRGYKTIQELFKDFNEEYEPIEVNWGNPAGKEIW